MNISEARRTREIFNKTGLDIACHNDEFLLFPENGASDALSQVFKLRTFDGDNGKLRIIVELNT